MYNLTFFAEMLRKGLQNYKLLNKIAVGFCGKALQCMVKRRRWKSKLQVRGVIMKKVVKFGGSSLANAEQFQKVGDIIRSDESRRYVGPSAPGPGFGEAISGTDRLYGC